MMFNEAREFERLTLACIPVDNMCISDLSPTTRRNAQTSSDWSEKETHLLPLFRYLTNRSLLEFQTSSHASKKRDVN